MPIIPVLVGGAAMPNPDRLPDSLKHKAWRLPESIGQAKDEQATPRAGSQASLTVNPREVRYSNDHLWVAPIGGGVFRIGITDYAQDALSDIVYIELPSVNKHFDAGHSFGQVESTEAVPH